MLAPTYSAPFGSTFGDGSLNFRVRNENGCTPPAKAPTFNLELDKILHILDCCLKVVKITRNMFGRLERGIGFEPTTLATA
jgi:hypothetical protein